MTAEQAVLVVYRGPTPNQQVDGAGDGESWSEGEATNKPIKTRTNQLLNDDKD